MKRTLERPRIKTAPRIRQVYWCDYPAPEHTEPPEFSKCRPVVVLSRSATLYGVVTVVPMTTKPQRDDKFSVQLVSPLGDRKAWVVCNHVHTVSTRRLSSPAGVVPRIPDDVFQAILRKVWRHLPLPRS